MNKYACFLELNCHGIEGPLPDCVLDKMLPSLCYFAEPGMKKEDCEYWKINDYEYTED